MITQVILSLYQMVIFYYPQRNSSLSSPLLHMPLPYFFFSVSYSSNHSLNDIFLEIGSFLRDSFGGHSPHHTCLFLKLHQFFHILYQFFHNFVAKELVDESLFFVRASFFSQWIRCCFEIPHFLLVIRYKKWDSMKGSTYLPHRTL